MASSAKKSATLGMPHGTAVGRLKKSILFHLLKKVNENNCFKCETQIEHIDDLSIEHKKPWEGISAELFWDLENVAFSHIQCNRPDRPSGRNVNAVVRPNGMNWCVPGRHFAPVEDFYKCISGVTGLQNWCKEHRYPR